MIPSFGAPEFLWLLLALPLLAWLGVRRQRRLERRRNRVFGAGLARVGAQGNPRREALARAAWLGGLACAVVALARPDRQGAAAEDGSSHRDVVICLDVSRSMRARDAHPDRLGAAKAAIGDWLTRHAGDRFALVVFAGEARLRVPLTSDSRSFLALLERVDEDSVSLGGTELAAALDLARTLRADGSAGGAIVVLTDGEDHGGAGALAAERAAAEGWRVHFFACGSELGAKVPIADAEGRESFLRGPDGAEVRSSVRPEALAAAARAGRGEAYALERLATTPTSALAPAAPVSEVERAAEAARSQPPHPVGLLLAIASLWMLAFALRTRRA